MQWPGVENAGVTGTRRSYGRHWLDAARHPARRDGAVLWALLALPWVGGLVLTRRHHHLDAGGWTLILTVSLGLPTLWVAWATFRDARRSGAAESGPGLPRIADELAVAVGRQWDREASVRRLNQPYPLPVSWAAAAGVAAPWESLTELAASGVGWPPPAPGRAWAAGPEELAGEGVELADVLGKVPTGRLVVLGEPGSGETMLMVRLVLDLLGRRAAGGPVPVLVPVASWDPSGQDLRDWLGTRLITDYPALAGPPPAGAAGPTRAAALIEAGLIVPVLDGLDEIPESARGAAVSRINDALPPGGQVLLTCRARQYQEAIRPPDGAEVTLAGAAAIELRPLDASAVRRYLRDDAPGAATARWDPVMPLLGTQAPAGQALRTPLMVALARVIYNPRPGEAAGPLRDPAELCGFTSRAAVETHLFDACIPAAYRPSAAGRWTAGQAERWLAFLACHLDQTIGTLDFAWWRLEKAVSRTALGLAGGLALGMEQTRWTSYVLARGWLAFRRQLPWPLMAFLADAHQRGVLRQAGATYQFRHLELQHRLATRSQQAASGSLVPPGSTPTAPDRRTVSD
jgi:hypothetical protein